MTESREPDEIQDPDPSNGEDAPHMTMQLEMSRSFSGPLPPPDLFRQYEEASPGTGKEIVEMAKAQRTHDHEMERRAHEIVRDHLPRRENTLRWAMALITFIAVIAIAAFSFTVYWEAATWEPYGVGGFLAFWPIALTIYRLLLRRRN